MVFGSFLLIALVTKVTPYSAHEYSRLGTVESLVERGTFQLDDSIFIDTLDKIQRNGHFYSHQPPLLSLIETPVYWGLRLSGMRFNNRGRLLMTYLFSLLTNGVAFVLTVVVFTRIFGLAGIAAPARDALALILPIGTWLFPYGLVANNHGIAGLLVAVLVYQLLKIEWQGATVTGLSSAGLALGVLTAIELLPLVSFVPLTITYLVVRGNLTRPAWVAFVGAFGGPLLVHAVANMRITGDVIPAGFHHELFRYSGSAFDETTLSGTIKHGTVSEAARYAWASLFAGKAYFTFAPIVALGLAAGILEWRWWWARAGGVYLVLLGGTLLSLAASLLTTNNFGGEAVGFRHATYLAPAMLALLLPWIARTSSAGGIKARAVVAIGTVSAASMLVFAAPRPWSNLTLALAAIRPIGDYVPIVAHLIRGDLLRP